MCVFACTCVCLCARLCAHARVRTCADARAKDCDVRDSVMSGSKESVACFKVVCFVLGECCYVTRVLIYASTICKYAA